MSSYRTEYSTLRGTSPTSPTSPTRPTRPTRPTGQPDGRGGDLPPRPSQHRQHGAAFPVDWSLLAYAMHGSALVPCPLACSILACLASRTPSGGGGVGARGAEAHRATGQPSINFRRHYRIRMAGSVGPVGPWTVDRGTVGPRTMGARVVATSAEKIWIPSRSFANTMIQRRFVFFVFFVPHWKISYIQ